MPRMILLLLLLTSNANAAFLITINSATIAPGGTVVIDTFVKQDALSSDRLDAFDLRFRIDSPSGRHLTFLNPQNDLFTSQSGYVFYGDSFGNLNGLTPVVSTTNYTNDTIQIGDFTVSGLGASVGPNDVFLTRFILTSTDGTLPPIIGDKFTISIDPILSYFLDPFGNSQSIISNISTITVIDQGANAVCAPSTLVLLLSGLLFRSVPHLKRANIKPK